MADPTDSRLGGLLRQCRDPLFVINSQRRLVFVNPALQALLGLDDWAGLLCRPRREAEPGSRQAWGSVLAPPPEVLAGEPARCRRLLPGPGVVRRWWDIDFLPLRGSDGVAAIVGRVLPIDGPLPATQARLAESLVALRQTAYQRYRLDRLPAAGQAMRRVVHQVTLACQTRVPVLLVGPAGSGKEWLARLIHAHGPTREGTLVRLDARRLPATALADALFGPPRWLERAGTIVLKEPQSLPRELQAQVVERLAEPETAARVIACSNVDPAEEVRAGRWLEDLHTVLATLVISLPALRDRPDDLPLWVERFLKPEHRLAPPAWDLLRRYAWPGNLTELRAALRTAAARAGGHALEPGHFPAHIRQAVALDDVPARPLERPLPLDAILEQVERRLIEQALEQAQGNKTRAAERLGIWRARLLRRMEALGIADREGGDGAEPEKP